MKLLEEIKVGNLVLKNRIMFPPLTTGYEERDGSIGKQSFNFYKRLAEGGVGYIVIGDVAPVNTASPTPKLFDDRQIPTFKKLADACHEHGAKLALQIFHPEYDVPGVGRMIVGARMAAVEAQKLKEAGDMAGFAAKMEESQKITKDAYAKLHHDMQHFVSEATKEQLDEIKHAIGECARRAMEAGVDAIQIHGDRLLGSLCSTILNHRTDEYGGCFENRIRYALEIVAAIREAAPALAIEYKLPMVTEMKDGKLRGKGGLCVEEGIAFAKKLEEAGVDMLHVAQANHTGNMGDTIPAMGCQPYSFFAKYASRVKEVVSIPVSTVGRILTPQNAEILLQTGKADVIALGRPLLTDPDFANKLAEGREDDVRLCISCNKGCTDSIQNRKFISCILNAENGYEYDRVIKPASSKKKVVVVGGGVAGLEAARVARIKGHDVVLFEKDTQLGGQLNIASVPPRKVEMKRAANWLNHQVKKLGVDLRLGREVCAHCVLEEQPDAVIVTVGAHNATPPIPGVNLPHVLDAWKILSQEQICSDRVVVIGGGLVGSETAEYLAEQGAQVTIVEMLDEIAKEESATVKPVLLESFAGKGVVQLTKTKVKEITLQNVVCTKEDGEDIEIPCDYVVMAAGAKPNAFDASALTEKGIPVIYAGDCNERASNINNAIEQGYLAANQID